MPQWAAKQWFVCVCKLDVMAKGKRGWVQNQQRSSISSEHKAALQAVFSIATGWIWPNKRETERKFCPIPADKRVLFQWLMSFLLEKCENLVWLKETRNPFLPTLSLFFFPRGIWDPYWVPVRKETPEQHNKSRRLIRTIWWGCRDCVYVQRELGGMIPCWSGLAECQCKFFFLFFPLLLSLLLMLQRQQMYVINCSLNG